MGTPHSVPLATPVIESATDLGQALCAAIDACAARGEANTFAYWIASDAAPHRFEVRALPLGHDDIVLLVHDAGSVPNQPVSLPTKNDRTAYALTARQLAVLRLIALGATDKEVGVNFGISTFTASKHVANILSKMQVSCRTEASVVALQSGLLQPA